MLLFGERKIGKTSMCSKFDDAYFFMCEKGGSALELYQDIPNDWREFKQYAASFLKSKYSLGVIDTIDQCYEMCFEYVMAQNGWEDPSDAGWGKGWKAIMREFRSVVDPMLADERGLIMLSHAQMKEVTTFDGLAYDQVRCTLGGKFGDYITGAVDIWAYYGYDNDDRRTLTLRGNRGLDAGIRLEERFLDQDGEPLAEIDLGTSSQESYNNLIAAFNNEYEPPRKPREKKRRSRRRKTTK